jgi:hypothetical protein
MINWGLDAIKGIKRSIIFQILSFSSQELATNQWKVISISNCQESGLKSSQLDAEKSQVKTSQMF